MPERKAATVGKTLTKLGLTTLAMMLLGFLTLMTFDLGRMFYLHHQLSNAVREGARFGSVVGENPQRPQFANCAGIRRIVERATTSSLIKVDVRYEDGQGQDARQPVCHPAMNLALLQHGDRIAVTARANFYFLTPLANYAGPTDIEVTSFRTLLLGIAHLEN